MVKSKIDSWQIDGFAVRPDFDNFGFFDNAPNHAVGFWGVYATRPLLAKHLFDVYYLGLDRKQATFERGTAQEVRHTLGARISRPVADRTAGWDFDYEGALAVRHLWLGKHPRHGPSPPIRAIGSRTLALKPRFSVKADISSGDNPESAIRSEPSIHFSRRETTLVSWRQRVLVRSISSTFIRESKLTFPHSVTDLGRLDFSVARKSLDGVYSVPGSLIRACRQ